MKLNHLTEADHAELARLLTDLQNSLVRAQRIVNRAPWTDRTLRIEKAVQERLIDPLRFAHDELRERTNEPMDRTGMYPAVGYFLQRR